MLRLLTQPSCCRTTASTTGTARWLSAASYSGSTSSRYPSMGTRFHVAEQLRSLVGQNEKFSFTPSASVISNVWEVREDFCLRIHSRREGICGAQICVIFRIFSAYFTIFCPFFPPLFLSKDAFYFLIFCTYFAHISSVFCAYFARNMLKTADCARLWAEMATEKKLH